MSTGIVLLAIAGLCQVLIAAANVPAAKVLNYRGELQRVSPMVREIFYVQNLYIELMLVAQAVLCWVFPIELLGGTALGTFWSAFLAAFWGLRLAIQFGWYDQAARKAHPVVDAGMIAFQVYLTTVYLLAALGVWKPMP
jgi:hypothetical protein